MTDAFARRLYRYWGNAPGVVGPHSAIAEEQLMGHVVSLTDPQQGVRNLVSATNDGLIPNTLSAARQGRSLAFQGRDVDVHLYGLHREGRYAANRSGLSVLVRRGASISVTGNEAIERFGLGGASAQIRAEVRASGPYEVYPPESVVGIANHPSVGTVPELVWPRDPSVAAQYGLPYASDEKLGMYSTVPRRARGALRTALLRARIAGRIVAGYNIALHPADFGGLGGTWFNGGGRPAAFGGVFSGLAAGLAGGIADELVMGWTGNDYAGIGANFAAQFGVLGVLGGWRMAFTSLNPVGAAFTVGAHFVQQQYSADMDYYAAKTRGASMPLPPPSHGPIAPDRDLPRGDRYGWWLSLAWE
jgi:hypothetical protein